MRIKDIKVIERIGNENLEIDINDIPTGMQTIQFRNRIKYIGCDNKIPFKSIFFCNKINTFTGNLLIDK